LIYKGSRHRRQTFINLSTAASESERKRVLILDIHTAGLFFTGQLLRPSFGKVGRERYFHLLCRKTPGSLEAGGLWGAVFRL